MTPGGQRQMAGPRSITVVLGYFDALVSRGLTQILRKDKDIQILSAGLDDGVLECVVEQHLPQVVIIDEASVVDRSDLMRRLRVAQPAIGIVVLAHRPTRAYGVRLLASGATCLPQNASIAYILATIRLAAEGKYIPLYAEDRQIEQRYLMDAVLLTSREAEVFEHLSSGQSHAEIAQALQIGIETVRTHTARIRSKLGVRSKRELIGLPLPSDPNPDT